MIRENGLGKKNSRQCVGFRYVGKFLLPIVSVCCMQAWAVELESAPGETKIVNENGTYTASQDLEFGALKVEAQNVTFEFSATPSRKVVLTESSAFNVATANANVYFKGGEWNANGNGSFYCALPRGAITTMFCSMDVFGRI